MTLLANRYVLAGIAVLALLAGLLGYRTHLIHLGAAQEAKAASVRQAKAVEAVRKADEAVTQAATADLNRRLINQQERHDRISSDLQAALAASDLRARRLDARVVGLLDRSAGVRPGTAGDAGGTRSAAGTAQADQAQPSAGTASPPVEGDASVADLIESADENYQICQRNASRLGALQRWYEGLRRGRAATAETQDSQ